MISNRSRVPCISGALVFVLVFALVVVLGGCGASAKSRTTSDRAGSEARVSPTVGVRSSTPRIPGRGEPRPATAKSGPTAEGEHISLSIEGLESGPSRATAERRISARYTCDGRDSSPPLRWEPIPAHAAELILFIMDMSAPGSRRVFDWAVAGLRPTHKGVSAGRLPASAVVGRNSLGEVGYSVCPPKGRANVYVAILYALPQRLRVKAGFDPNSVYATLAGRGLPEGQAGFSYTRAPSAPPASRSGDRGSRPAVLRR
jgi:phosphatidylethanolamine-binding protein (PEBP) family uncharacterized protein